MGGIILSDFVMTKIKGRDAIDLVFFAEVTVSTTAGALWWKKTTEERRKITREYAGCGWHFVDNGEMCPSDQAEALERAYKARTGLLAE